MEDFWRGHERIVLKMNVGQTLNFPLLLSYFFFFLLLGCLNTWLLPRNWELSLSIAGCCFFLASLTLSYWSNNPAFHVATPHPFHIYDLCWGLGVSWPDPHPRVCTWPSWELGAMEWKPEQMIFVSLQVQVFTNIFLSQGSWWSMGLLEYFQICIIKYVRLQKFPSWLGRNEPDQHP